MRILLLLVLLCVGASALERIIHRIVEEKTWVEALAYCRRHHTDLLPIRNPTENEEITENGWIGLNRRDFPWKWKWSSGHVYDFRIWASGEPDLWENCGFKKAGDTGWHSKHCSSKFPFYCVDDPLVFVEEKKQWEEALEHCRNLTLHHPTVHKNHRYDLASPLTLDDDDTQNVFQGSFKKVWIGLRFLGGRWLWLNGQNYDDPLTNCPQDHRCGALENNVTVAIGRRRCDAKFVFLCARR